MSSRVFGCCLALVAVCAGAAAEEGPKDWDAALAIVDGMVKAAADESGGPGFSVAVVSRRHRAHFVHHGYADIERKIPADAHTVYEIGSITKIFTGTMLMQMRDAGKARAQPVYSELEAPDGADALIGEYAHGYGILPPVRVAAEKGALVLRDEAWGESRLAPAGPPRRFVIETGQLLGESVGFERQGQTMRLSIGHGAIVYMRAKAKHAAP